MAFKTDGTRTKGKMRLSRGVMAHGTLGNGLGAAWQMINMAVKAGDICFMLAASPFNIGGFRSMAFYTIGIQQFVGSVQGHDLLGRGPELGAACSC